MKAGQIKQYGVIENCSGIYHVKILTTSFSFPFNLKPENSEVGAMTLNMNFRVAIQIYVIPQAGV